MQLAGLVPLLVTLLDQGRDRAPAAFGVLQMCINTETNDMLAKMQGIRCLSNMLLPHYCSGHEIPAGLLLLHILHGAYAKPAIVEKVPERLPAASELPTCKFPVSEAYAPDTLRVVARDVGAYVCQSCVHMQSQFSLLQQNSDDNMMRHMMYYSCTAIAGWPDSHMCMQQYV